MQYLISGVNYLITGSLYFLTHFTQFSHPTTSVATSLFTVSMSVLGSVLSVQSDSLRLHGQQHTRPPFPSPTPRVYPNSCPLSWWCHPTISSFVFPFSSSFNLAQHHGLFKWVNEHSGLISFRMDWLDLLAVQGTLKSLLQHHSSKASILRCSAFFIVQLSHPYMTTGKTIALTRQTFVGKVMSLLFNMLSRLVITFLPRNKHLLISWLQSPSTVILERPK